MNRMKTLMLIGIILLSTIWGAENIFAVTDSEEFLIYAYANETLKNQDVDLMTRSVVLVGAAIIKEIYDNAKGGNQGTFNLNQISIRISGIIIAECLDAVLDYISDNFINKEFHENNNE